MKRAVRTLTSLLLVVVLGALVGVLVLNLAPAFTRPSPPANASQPTATPPPSLAPASPTALQPLGADGKLPDATALRKSLDAAFGNPSTGAFTGEVADLATGKVLYSRKGNQASAPASNLKILTTTAALDLLGGDTTLPTRAMLDADDTVVLVGGGDVLLGAGTSEPDAIVSRAGLETLATRTAAALFAADRLEGGSKHELHVVLDDSLFTGDALNPVWDESLMRTSNITAVQPIAKYGARRDAGPKSTRVKDPAMDAAATFRAALARAVAAEQKKADAAASEPAPGRASSASTSTAASASSSASTSTAASSGAAAARPPRIVVGGDVVRGQAGEGAHRLAEVRSAPVREQLEFMGEESDNYVAEAMGRLVAIAAGKPATFGGATETLRETAKSLGVDVDGMSLSDASGLSDRTRLTPRQLTGVIRAAATSDNPDLRDVSYLLPISGATGTLKDRLDAAPTRGEIRAKTGTLTGVSTLSGTAVTADGRVLAFSFFGHGFEGSLAPARAGLDRAAAVLAGCGCTP